MCTLTINFEGRRTRAVFSRDELKERAPGLAPRWAKFGDVRAIGPVDGHAGGTWIAANEHGMVLCLLNANPPGPTPPLDPARSVSRGLIVPELIHFREAEHAAAALSGRDLGCFAPFRMVAFGVREADPVREIAWDRRRVEVRSHERRPLCFVSSGLGDRVVLPRLGLFEEFCRWGFDASAQDRFHRHRWADRPAISVLMEREEARTVSLTTVTVEPGEAAARVEMGYEPVESLRGAPGAQPVQARA